MLKDTLDTRAVSLGNEVKDWRAAIETSGRLLVDSEAAEEEYVAAMIRTTEELGPYVAITHGVEKPQARFESGAKTVGLSLAMLSEPVEFGSRENNPVDRSPCATGGDGGVGPCNATRAGRVRLQGEQPGRSIALRNRWASGAHASGSWGG